MFYASDSFHFWYLSCQKNKLIFHSDFYIFFHFRKDMDRFCRFFCCSPAGTVLIAVPLDFSCFRLSLWIFLIVRRVSFKIFSVLSFFLFFLRKNIVSSSLSYDSVLLYTYQQYKTAHSTITWLTHRKELYMFWRNRIH